MTTTSSSSPPSVAAVNEYLRQKQDNLSFFLNPDRTLTRLYEFPSTPATPDPTSPSPVLSKDLPLNPQHNTFLRIFLPRQALDNSTPSATRLPLPLVVYFHGGGFFLCSAASTFFHDFCVEMAIRADVMIASVEYRRPPEHRLPAAYDDAVEALHLIRTSGDEWLRDFADFSNCFLMGTSAGGNIAYHVGLRVASVVDDLLPLKIKGLVLHQAFFGGSERTPSELRSVDHPWLPLLVNDLSWELSLPIGADRDHEYCDLTVSIESKSVDQIRVLGWKILVSGCNGDPLIDREMELVRALEKKGVGVVALFDDGGYHGAQMLDPSIKESFLATLKKFIHLSNLAALPGDDEV